MGRPRKDRPRSRREERVEVMVEVLRREDEEGVGKNERSWC